MAAEFGDKTQIAIAGLAGGMSPFPVWIGATIALVMVSALGIWAGRTVLQRIPLHWPHRVGGGFSWSLRWWPGGVCLAESGTATSSTKDGTLTAR